MHVLLRLTKACPELGPLATNPSTLHFAVERGGKATHTQLNTCSLPVPASHRGRQCAFMRVTYCPGPVLGWGGGERTAASDADDSPATRHRFGKGLFTAKT